MESTKRCTTCNEVKTISNFYNHRGRRDGKNNTCIQCKKDYNLRNKERDLSTGRKYHRKNSKTRNKYSREYKKANKGLINGINSFRHAQKLKAVPPWISKEDKKTIKYIYTMASIWSLLVKSRYNIDIKYTVDHIIPLQGKEVCGLHIPINLQILPAKINCSKSNKLSVNL